MKWFGSTKHHFRPSGSWEVRSHRRGSFGALVVEFSCSTAHKSSRWQGWPPNLYFKTHKNKERIALSPIGPERLVLRIGYEAYARIEVCTCSLCPSCFRKDSIWLKAMRRHFEKELIEMGSCFLRCETCPKRIVYFPYCTLGRITFRLFQSCCPLGSMFVDVSNSNNQWFQQGLLAFWSQSLAPSVKRTAGLPFPSRTLNPWSNATTSEAKKKDQASAFGVELEFQS